MEEERFFENANYHFMDEQKLVKLSDKGPTINSWEGGGEGGGWVISGQRVFFLATWRAGYFFPPKCSAGYFFFSPHFSAGFFFLKKGRVYMTLQKPYISIENHYMKMLIYIFNK